VFNHGNGKIRKDWWDLTPNACSPNLMPYSVEGKEIMRGQGFLYNRKNIIDPNGFDMRGLFFVATCKSCSDYMSWLLNVHTKGVTRVCEAPLLDYNLKQLAKVCLGGQSWKTPPNRRWCNPMWFQLALLAKKCEVSAISVEWTVVPQFAAIVAATSNLLLWTLLLAVCPEMTENMKSMYGL